MKSANKVKISMEDINYIFDKVMQEERELCRNHMQLNPYDQLRQRDRDMVCLGATKLWQALYRFAEEGEV